MKKGECDSFQIMYNRNPKQKQYTAIYSIVWRNRKDINATNSKLKMEYDKGRDKQVAK